MFAICYDFKFKEKDTGKIKDNKDLTIEQNQGKNNKNNNCYLTNKEFLDNHLVFKIPIEKSQEIFSGRPIFNSFFLSFAKKVALTKICKRFQHMMS